uniref:hypothetical protein n=1 Tax=Acetatifactor sp. TaxID=1872090 RepID=UPI004056F646
MIAMAALVTAICTAVMGREALVDAYYYGAEVFSGSIYDLPEFRAYVAELYNKAMNGYAGIGDHNGYPLTDSHAVEYSRQAKQEFEAMIKSLGNDIVYYIRKPGPVNENGYIAFDELSNVTYPIFSEYDGHLLLPEDVMLCCYWDGEKSTLTFFESYGNTNAADSYYAAQYKPNEEGAENIKLVLAVKKDCKLCTLEMMEYKAARYQEIFVTLLVCAGLWVISGLFSVFTGKTAKAAKEEYGRWSGKIFLEIKVIGLVVAGCIIAFWGLYT